jgi:DNA-binding transcriptional MerR regulator
MREAETLRVQEFARLAGVTVRALHVYDQAGLLAPAARTAHGHRRYRIADLLRLQQIVTLKHLGFSLEEIKTLLGAPAYDLRESLSAQKSALEAEILRLQGAVFALGRTLETLDEQGGVEWAHVVAAIRGLREADRTEWLSRFYPPERWSWLLERAAQAPPDLLEQGFQAWRDLFERFDAVRQLPPEHPEVQALAARMDQLIGMFTGGDAAIERGVEGAWSTPGAAQALPQGPWSDSELHAFAGLALTHYRSQKRGAP